jgi:putative transposase
LLPKTFPPWQATYKSFSRWAAAGVFETMHDRLRQQWRDRIGKAPEPTAAIIDAQSMRSTAQGGNTGFDAGRKVKGRKRQLVVDTLGLLLAVTVTAASVQDRDAAAEVMAQACLEIPVHIHAWNERARRLMAHHDRSDWAPPAWVWRAEARNVSAGLAT